MSSSVKLFEAWNDEPAEPKLREDRRKLFDRNALEPGTGCQRWFGGAQYTDALSGGATFSSPLRTVVPHRTVGNNSLPKGCSPPHPGVFHPWRCPKG